MGRRCAAGVRLPPVAPATTFVPIRPAAPSPSAGRAPPPLLAVPALPPLLAALAAALLLSLPAAPLHAQSASVSGTVSGAAGEPLEGVEVVLLAAGRQAAVTRTDGRGGYVLGDVAPGTYGLIFRHPGFGELRVDGLRVEPGAALRRDAVLEPGAVVLDRIAVTAQRRREKALDAPAGVSVVDAARIEARPALAVFDHVKELPGIAYTERGLLSRSYMVRGRANLAPGGGAYTLTDYRLASVPSLALSVPYLLPGAEEDLERIELLRGPASALYGPNAVSGVLHLVTRSPFDSPGTRLSLAAGERETFRAALRHARAVGDDVAFRLTGQYLRGRDWESHDPLERAERDHRVEQYAADARVDVRTRGGTELVLSAGTATAASAIELVAPGAYQVRDWRYDYVQARLSRGRLFAQAYLNGTDAGGSFALRTLDPVVDRSRMFVAQLQHGADLGPVLWTYGLDLQYTDPRTAGTVNGRNEADDHVLETGAYLHGEARLAPRWRVVAASRLDRHGRVDGTFFSPRAALLFEPAPGHALRFTYNRAFRAPSTLDLFLDIRSGRLEPLPYEAWVRASPRDGWRFRRDCAGGLCMRSPFAPGQALPLDATLGWDALVEGLQEFGVDLSGVPAPGPGDVRTVLRSLDPDARSFVHTTPAAVRDVEPLQRTAVSAYELGYKGLFGGRLLVEADAYIGRITGFIRGPFVLTPSAFLDRDDLTAHLGRYMPADRALQLARLIGGVSGSAQTPGIPLGTVAPDHPTADHHITLTYESFGAVDQVGADLWVELLLGRRLSLAGAYTWFRLDGLAPGLGDAPDRPFRAPHATGSAAVRFRDDAAGRSAALSARFARGYQVHGGVYEGRIDALALLDLNLGYRLPLPGRPLLTLDGRNILDRRRPQQPGAPAIGRLVMARLSFE